MHSGCWIIDSGEDDNLLEERRGNRDVTNGVCLLCMYGECVDFGLGRVALLT